jgi:hypothetical protein
VLTVTLEDHKRVLSEESEAQERKKRSLISSLPTTRNMVKVSH